MQEYIEPPEFQRLLFFDGLDTLGRPVVVVNADALGDNKGARKSAFQHIVNVLEPIVIQVRLALSSTSLFQMLVWVLRQVQPDDSIVLCAGSICPFPGEPGWGHKEQQDSDRAAGVSIPQPLKAIQEEC
jgi:hypothetical protein